MQWSSILLLTAYTYPFFVSSANLNVCQSLDRLNRTAQRVSPLVGRLVELHDRHACVGIFPSELDAGSMDGSGREDVAAVRGDIHAVHDMLRKLDGRIEVRKKGCVESVVPESLGVRRWIGDEIEVEDEDEIEVEVEVEDEDSDDSDEDEDDDDGICELDDVVEALVDTLEFLLSFVGV